MINLAAVPLDQLFVHACQSQLTIFHYRILFSHHLKFIRL